MTSRSKWRPSNSSSKPRNPAIVQPSAHRKERKYAGAGNLHQSHIKDLDPRLQTLAQEFLDRCEVAGIQAIITQTWRSPEEQDLDYAQGRSAPGHVIINAKGGQSPHNCTLPDGAPAARAFDFAIMCGENQLDWDAEDSEWQDAIAIVKALGLVSGSTCHGISDSPHAEIRDGRLHETRQTHPRISADHARIWVYVDRARLHMAQRKVGKARDLGGGAVSLVKSVTPDQPGFGRGVLFATIVEL
jgi:peptidoglycan L-alanyl-D-glutamate endopeptidase CwlK